MIVKPLISVAVRWLWLVVLVTAVTAGAVAYQLATAPGAYEATTRLQLTVPQAEEVALVSGYRASNLRDDMTLSRNNFLVALRSREVYDRTIRSLALQAPDTGYEVEARLLRDTDFVDVVVPVREPELAAAIANTHVSEAIRYYGELRALPAAATKAFLGEQLRATAERIRPPPVAGAAPDAVSPEEDRQVREAYQLLLKKYSEATLLEQSAQRVNYIQVVQSASPPPAPVPNRRMLPLVVLSLVGGGVLGLLLALLLDALTGGGRRGRAAPVPLVRAAQEPMPFTSGRAAG